MDQFKIEEVLAERNFIRSLGYALLRNHDEVDEIEQEVYTRALLYPPSLNYPIRPWIGTVMRRLVGKRWNRDEHRRFVETRAARNRLEAQGEAGEHASISMLRRALKKLDGDTQNLLTQHHFGNRTLRELAEDQGIQVETLRTRHYRAIQKLRSSLDQQHGGDRRRWAVVLLPAIGAKRWGLAPTLACILGLSVLLVNRSSSHGPGAVLETEPDQLRLKLAISEADAGPTVRLPVPEVEVSMGTESAGTEASPGGELLFVKVLDGVGGPVAGARILGICAGQPFGDPVGVGTSGPDGGAVVGALGLDAWIWAALEDGRQSRGVFKRTIQGTSSEEPWTLRLVSTSFALEGRVIDEQGVPISDVRVKYASAGAIKALMGGVLSAASPVRSSVTREDGRFSLPNLSVRGWHHLLLESEERGQQSMKLSGDTRRSDLVFYSPADLLGRVAECGTAEFEAPPACTPSVWVSQHGRVLRNPVAVPHGEVFRIQGLPGTQIEVHASCGTAHGSRSIGLQGVDQDLGELELSPNRLVHGQLVDPLGQPLARWLIQNAPSRDLELHPSFATALQSPLDPAVSTDSEGRFILRSPVHGDIDVWALPPGSELHDPGWAVEVLPAGKARVALQVHSLDSPHGVVEGAILHGGESSGSAWFVGCSGRGLSQPVFVDVDSASGHYRIEGLPPGECTVRAFQGTATKRSSFAERLEVEPGLTHSGIDLRLEGMATINLVVRFGDGRLATGIAPPVWHKRFAHPTQVPESSMLSIALGAVRIGPVASNVGYYFLEADESHAGFFDLDSRPGGSFHSTVVLPRIQKMTATVAVPEEVRRAGLVDVFVHNEERSVVGRRLVRAQWLRKGTLSVNCWTVSGEHTATLYYGKQSLRVPVTMSTK